MKYKIAFFSFDWLHEIVEHKQIGIHRFLKDYDNISIDMFQNFGNYDIVNPMDSLLELYKMPSIENYDAIVFQTNSNFYKDYRQHIIQNAHQYHIPVVSINDPIEGCVYVGTDNKKAIYDMTKMLINEKKCQKIYYISGPTTSREAHLRKQGFIEATEDLKNIKIIDANWSINGGRIAAQTLLQDLPEAIVCANDNIAHGVIEVLLNHHIEVGKDIYVTGFDNLTISKTSPLRITTIDRDYESITYLAFKTAYDLILKNPHNIVYTPFRIIKSSSCGYNNDEKEIRELKDLCLSHFYQSSCFFESSERLELELSHISNFYELFQFFEKESQNYGFQQIYFVINSKYIESLSGDITQYSDLMYLMGITYHNQKPDSNHIYETFYKRIVLPTKYKSRFMIYTSLSNNGQAIGYLGFDGCSDKISIDYMTIILKLFGLTIDSIRKKQALSSLNQKLENLYIKDSLTDCYNRFGMNQLGKPLYNELLKKNKNVLIYFIDMDHMKSINDLYGHDVGDIALVETAQIILNNIETNDFVIRYGGDEFIIISHHLYDSLSEKVQHFLKTINAKHEFPFSLSLSIGHYLANESDTFEHAINQADNVMYEIKKAKKAQRKD